MSFYRVQYGYLCLKITWKIESVTHNWRNCLQIMPKNWFESQIPGRTYNIVRGKSAFNVGCAYAYNIKYEMLLFKHKQLVTSAEKVFSPWILHRMISRTICYGIILFKCGQYPYLQKYSSEEKEIAANLSTRLYLAIIRTFGNHWQTCHGLIFVKNRVVLQKQGVYSSVFLQWILL